MFSFFYRHIRWDEETIREQDKERGTRQKIDEPDTPFVHGAPKLNLDCIFVFSLALFYTVEELPNEEDNCMVNIVVNDDNCIFFVIADFYVNSPSEQSKISCVRIWRWVWSS